MGTKRAGNLTLVQKGDEPEAATAPLSLALITRMMAWTRPYAAKRNILLGIVILRSLQLATTGWLLGWVVDRVVAGDGDAALIGTIAFAALAVFTAVTFHFRMRFALELGEAVVADLRVALFDHLQRLPMSFYDRTKLGRIISRVISDVESVRVGVQDVLFVGMVNVGQMLGAGVFMLLIDWRLFLVVLAISPVLWGVNAVFRNRFSTAFRDLQESFSRVTATIAESVNGIRVTQGFSRQRVNAELFGDLVADHAGRNVSVARLRGFFMPLLDLNTQVFLAVLLLLGGWLVLAHGEVVTTITSFFFLATVFFGPIETIGNQYTQALTAMAGAERVFRLLDREPEWQDAPDAVDLPTIAGAVRFEDVSFSYIAGSPVLQEVSFQAEPGELIALVGQTGSGKSTIIKLISKFYLPGAGRVLIDGHDLAAVRGESLHRQLGIVLQVNFLFTGTVLENIRFAKPSASEAEVRAVAAHLDCLDLLEALPAGLQTQVGEGGGALSLGQRQLVCFCRAMLADPRILILDEATSAVDTITEVRIQRALEILLQGRTSFVVAHRLSTIRHATQVLLLDAGRIVERGSHRALLEQGGRYAELYRQFIRAGGEDGV